ncbi:uncharacterized protein LOC119159462 [Rhipicephalus microplus]|uniref:uncharacterized protein LOC119159462 n=1 Tax=Rhipicephalus microplus TaxID=6941 RepID=UPI003F6B1E86
MSKRRRLLSVGEPSPLLLQLEIDAEEDSSSDDDDLHVYATKFAEPLPVFKVQEYVRKVVHSYSEEQFRSNFRLPRRACYDLIRQFEKSDFFPFDRHHRGAPAETPEEHILSFLW